MNNFGSHLQNSSLLLSHIYHKYVLVKSYRGIMVFTLIHHIQPFERHFVYLMLNYTPIEDKTNLKNIYLIYCLLLSYQQYNNNDYNFILN